MTSEQNQKQELIDQYCRLYSPRFSLDVEVTVHNLRSEGEERLTERLLANRGQRDQVEVVPEGVASGA